MKIEKYYDPDGEAHSVRYEYRRGQYVLYVDDVYYTAVDDRDELDEAVRELKRYRQYTTRKPKRKTPLVPASS